MGETPSPLSGPLVIDGYGAGGFRISGQTYNGSIVILPDGVHSWPVTDATALTVADFALVTAASPKPEILLIGCGRRSALIAPTLRQALRAAGVVIDAMDTGAACRTYNV